MGEYVSQLKSALEGCFSLQTDTVETWHTAEPDVDSIMPRDGKGQHVCQGWVDGLEGLRAWALAEHVCNFSLWHVEDTARRRDVDATVIADCKQRIDALNQKRNDCIEQVDACLLNLLVPLLPAPDGGQKLKKRYNTESPGLALDRMSILSLKIFHMMEQTLRADVSMEHINACRAKLDILREQRRDLASAVLDLLDEYADGRKTPKLYHQFKMYNDPALNPELYQVK